MRIVILKARIWLLGFLGLTLVGCATHDPNLVKIEDRSANSSFNRGANHSEKPQLNTAVDGSTSQRQANAAGQSKDWTLAKIGPVTKPDTGVKPVEPVVGEAIPTAPQPLITAPPSQPSGALLALLERAEQQHQQGQNQRALSSLERAQRIAPREPLVYLQLARLRKDMKDYPRAEQLVRKGLSLSSGNAEMQKAFKSLLSQLK